MTLTFDPAVEYDHISVMQTIDGVVLETRAEVGLLTRNVVVRGSVQDEWTETIEACEEEFDTSKCTILMLNIIHGEVASVTVLP